jgi:hypothetical protein
LNDLYWIKVEGEQEEDVFNAEMRAAFDASETDAVPSNVDVPITSLACPQDAQDAEAAATDFVATLDDMLTYISFLRDSLEECCNDLEVDYDGIKLAVAPKMTQNEEQATSLIEALWVFKGADVDAMGNPAEESLEDFIVRYRAEYDATDPLVVPAMHLETFINVPSLCPPATIEAAQELLDMVGALSDMISYNEYMVE